MLYAAQQHSDCASNQHRPLCGGRSTSSRGRTKKIGIKTRLQINPGRGRAGKQTEARRRIFSTKLHSRSRRRAGRGNRQGTARSPRTRPRRRQHPVHRTATVRPLFSAARRWYRVLLFQADAGCGPQVDGMAETTPGAATVRYSQVVSVTARSLPETERRGT